MSDDWLPPRSPGSRPEAGSLGSSLRELPAGSDSSPSSGGPPEGPNTSATVSLILGALGVVLVLISAGLLFIITLPVSVAGWIVGRSALKQARRGGAGREGLARAAMWIGVGGTGLSVVALIVWTTLLAIDDNILDDIEHEIEEFEREQGDGGGGGRSVGRLGVIAALRVTGLFTG